MTRFWDIATDMVLYGGWGILFSRLLLLLEERPTGGMRGKRWRGTAVCILPIYLWRGLIGYCRPVQEFFYHGQSMFQDSRDTILTSGMSLLVLFVCGCILYPRRKALVLYMTILFGAVSELLRFGIYSLTIWINRKAVDYLCLRLEEEAMEAELFYRRLALVQGAWNVIYFCLYLAGIAACVNHCRRSHQAAGRLPRGRELFYLSVPSLLSLSFGILMRSILLLQVEGRLRDIFQDNESLHLLTPVICGLCVGMVLGSLRIWSRIIREEREKSELLIYQSRVQDMERYVGDLERMQDGLAGIRHDLKNYMADIQSLLSLREDPRVQKELSGYLAGMERTLEECEIHCPTGNPVTDVLLNRHMQQAKALGIRTDWALFFPEELKIDPFDMSVILNNGLNNALEACRRLPEERRWITLRGRSQGRIFLLEMKNPADASFAVTPGQGMKNMMRCTKKYQGHMEWELREGEFRLTVLLQAQGEQRCS